MFLSCSFKFGKVEFKTELLFIFCFLTASNLCVVFKFDLIIELFEW